MADYGWVNLQGHHKDLFCTINVSIGEIENQRNLNNIRFKGGEVVNPFEDVYVIGLIKGAGVSSNANWESRLEGKSLDTGFASTAALLQTGELANKSEDWFKWLGINGSDVLGDDFVGKTTNTIGSSIQVWSGVEPMNLDVTLSFNAFNNALIEVEKPIAILHQMSAPTLKNGIFASDEGVSKLGDIPFDLDVSFANKRFVASYVLESISENEDSRKIDSNGYRISQEVSLSFKSKRALNRNDIKDNFIIQK